MMKTVFSIILLLCITKSYSQDYFEINNLGVDYYNAGDYKSALTQFEEAIELLDRLKWKKFKREFIFLNASSSAACLGDSVKAVAYLKDATLLGYFNYDDLIKYPCINTLMESNDFNKLVEEMQVKHSKYSNVKAELEEIKRRDQVLRRLVIQASEAYSEDSLMLQTYHSSSALLDSINVQQIRNILDNYGWLEKSKIGTEASDAFWLVLTHGDKKLIDTYLPLVKEQARIGNIDGDQYAIFYDKYLIKNDQKQKYGTQLKLDKIENVYHVRPVQDSVNLDKIRAEIGMESIIDYMIFCEELFGKKAVFD